MAEKAVADGSAFEKCKQMFAAQGGDISVLEDYSRFAAARYNREILAEETGYIYSHDTEKIGSASVLLGAGRLTKTDEIDFAAGITLHKKTGDYVEKGQSIATFYADDEALFDSAEKMFKSGLVIKGEKPVEAPLVYARVTKNGVERFY